MDANLLPRVVSGTSAGGLIASFVCCYTEDELKTLLVPELANRITACEDPFSVWFNRFWKTGTIVAPCEKKMCSQPFPGARFDTLSWAKKVLVILYRARHVLTYTDSVHSLPADPLPSERRT